MLLDSNFNAASTSVSASLTVKDIFAKQNISLHFFKDTPLFKGHRNHDYIALDYGEKRIGIAGANFYRVFSLGICHYKTRLQRFNTLKQYVNEWKPSAIILGLPMHADGSAHLLTNISCNFGLDLYRYFSLPIIWVDERYTSCIIHAQHQQYIDDQSAMLISQDFIDTCHQALFYIHL